MDYLLHIDTSADSCIVALSGNGELLVSRINEESRNHAAALNIMIQGLLSEAQITLNDLKGIIVCAGPGSYTGLRVGMANAKGLCYALDIPLLLDSKLTLLSYCATIKIRGYKHYVSILTAREREYFMAAYNEAMECIVEPRHVFEDDLISMLQEMQNTCVISGVPDVFINSLKVNNFKVVSADDIDLKLWSFYGYRKYKCNDIVKLSDAEPYYLKQVYTHK